MTENQRSGGFPTQPSSLKPSTNDLLNRLQSFLPKIQQANQSLDKEADRIDVELNPDCIDRATSSNGEESGSDDENSSSDIVDEQDADGSQPIIQLKLTLGSLDNNNPAFRLLANDDDNVSDGEDSSSESVDDDLASDDDGGLTATTSHDFVQSLLAKREGQFPPNPEDKRRQLITEVDD